MVDIVVRGEQDRRQFAGQADQGPVEDRLLLGFDLLRLPPKLFGPQDGGDAPPEPLGRLPLPHLVFGILHGHMLLPRDILLWRCRRKYGEEREKREFISCDEIRQQALITMEERLVCVAKTFGHCWASQMEIKCHSHSAERHNRLALPLFWFPRLREAVNKRSAQPL